jgi:hypothetical protein
MTVIDAHEHAERAEHAAKSHDPFITQVSITIAILAVLAAIVGSLETVESSTAITASSRSVLYQDQATDTWNEYQFDSLKKHIYGVAADRGGPDAARYRKAATDATARQAEVQVKAKTLETKREQLTALSEAAEKRHHWLTAASALLEIAIGISSVSIITRQRLFWYGAMALGLGGLVLFGIAFLA